jgi:hypothetical protein
MQCTERVDARVHVTEPGADALSYHLRQSAPHRSGDTGATDAAVHRGRAIVVVAPVEARRDWTRAECDIGNVTFAVGRCD